MAKKKRKKGSAPKKSKKEVPQALTALSMAWEEAKSKKNAIASSEEKPRTKLPPREKRSAANLPPKRKRLPESPMKTKQDRPAPAPAKPKRVYVPPPKASVSEVSIQTRKAVPPSNKKAPPHLSSTESAKEKIKKSPLKPVADKPIILDLNRQDEGHRKGDPAKIKKRIPNLCRPQIFNGKPKDESDIVIGFDFGTSSSKVVIRDYIRQTAYAVPFGSFACTNNPYLIPTRIYIEDEGAVNLSKGRHLFNHLKTQLLDNPEKHLFENTEIAVPEIAAAYLGMVIRLAREWFLKETHLIYKKSRINWYLNLGIPSKNYDDKYKKNSFKCVAMAAWKLSLYENQITTFEAKDVLKEAETRLSSNGDRIDSGDVDSGWLHPDYVNTHPEVIMEVVGYVRSSLRTSGLHLLVDIGATTFDCATFIVHQTEGEDVYPLLSTKVERYGTIILHNRRIEDLKNRLQGILQGKSFIEPTSPLPEVSHYSVQDDPAFLNENDQLFFRECYKIIGEVIRETKNRKDPFAPAWEKGLPVFICGGGGRYPLYRKTVRNLSNNIAQWLPPLQGLVVKDIPKPDQLFAPGLAPQEYDRLAVAYGLSFSPDEIGHIIPQSKIKNISAVEKVRDVETRFVGKDLC